MREPWRVAPLSIDGEVAVSQMNLILIIKAESGDLWLTLNVS